jgi:hypothetical protein
MKFAVSVALAMILLALPLACVLSTCQILEKPCCPRTGANLKCPYDYLDAAKAATVVAIASAPAAEIAIVPPARQVAHDDSPVADSSRADLCILNRILRI